MASPVYFGTSPTFYGPVPFILGNDMNDGTESIKKENQTGMETHWSGRIAIRPGIGIFQGLAGDNAPHRHWAHQASIGLEGGLGLEMAGVVRHRRAWFVPASRIHRFLPGPMLSIYLDPTSDLARFFVDDASLAGIRPIPENLANRILEAVGNEPSLVGVDDRLRRFLDPLGTKPPDDPRLECVLQVLRESIGAERAPTRERLAEIVGLSESRFSHWFRERSGMPARGYRKWLRLADAVESALAGKNLTAAAHAAGFSDQAHFTRAFVEAFGIAPSGVLRRLIAD